jgi:hypothetical protein
MKIKLITAVCLAAVLGASLNSAQAEEAGAGTVVADVALVRPACLVATVVGSAFFVVALPFALASKSVKKAAKTLVVKPARATFTRPLGDMDALTQ